MKTWFLTQIDELAVSKFFSPAFNQKNAFRLGLMIILEHFFSMNFFDENDWFVLKILRWLARMQDNNQFSQVIIYIYTYIHGYVSNES